MDEGVTWISSKVIYKSKGIRSIRVMMNFKSHENMKGHSSCYKRSLITKTKHFSP